MSGAAAHQAGASGLRLAWRNEQGQVMQGLVGHGMEVCFCSRYREKPRKSSELWGDMTGFRL